MSTSERSAAAQVRLVGGRLALDFVNTVDMHHGEERVERLLGYGDLVDWAEHAGSLDAAEAPALRRAAAEQPDRAQAVLDRAVALREALYRALSAATQPEAVAPADLALLNDALREMQGHRRLAPSAEGLDWTWDEDPKALDRPLWPVLRDAAELLTSDAVHAVRECGMDDCDWLFLDLSRNGRRRWCSMDTCGNRAKARRHYHRQLAQVSGEP
jgi:predicted RNA-binding Zn ribbon-like protein